MQCENVRVLQVRRSLDLRQKPLGTNCHREFGLEHFDCDHAVVLEFLGEIHSRHTAGAKFADKVVATGEGGGEAFEGVGHPANAPSAGARLFMRASVGSVE